MPRRIRKHANPFSVRIELGRIDRRATFGREAPLEVEIGSGAGRFLWARALANPDRDFIGLEVRDPLVDGLMARPDRPPNLVYLFCNANQNLRIAEPGVIHHFHVHFPDPCFKARHYKRRVVQPNIVRTMAELLPLGGRIYAQSDVRLLAEEMNRFFAAEDALASVLGPDLAVPRPVPEKTEWETHHEVSGEPIWRMLFEKVREPQGPVPTLRMGPVRRLEDEASESLSDEASATES